ncbi:MAG: hypothetical protein AAB586_01525 [Patescibacteria group bacterium]|mgnify:CR=1 FL=1
MPKHIEDIIVSDRKRSIRDIPIPEGRRRFERHGVSPVPKETNQFNGSPRENFNIPPKETPYIGGRGRRKWIAGGIALLILVFAIMSIFNGATLAYVPKSQAVSFNGDLYTAHKAGEDNLLFSVVKLSGERGMKVSASGETSEEKKASGTIIIYNTSVTEQRFRATTRFETPDGQVYQVPDAITVPEKKVIGGKENPGTLEIVVYAERPGKEFNIGLTDFILPGLKGTSLFSSVYARSKTNMSGGAIAGERAIKNEDEVAAKSQLEKLLKEELISEAKAQVPEDFILLSSLSSVTFWDLPQTDSDNENSVMINMHADLSGIIFKKVDLANRLVADKIMLAIGESVDIVELDSLGFAFINNTATDSIPSDEIRFSVQGEAIAIWRVDEVALKSDLIGKSKRDLPSILNNYPTIIKATATIRPFWNSSFPEDGANISLKKLSAR